MSRLTRCMAMASVLNNFSQITHLAVVAGKQINCPLICKL